MNYSKARKFIKLKRTISQTRGLRFVATKLADRYLWRFSYRSVARALMIGLFWMMIPIPFQMIPAIIMCVYLRANIPLAIGCVWLSNPITWIPLYFCNYLFGSFLLGLNINIVNWQLYAIYVMDNISKFWQPLYLGSFVGGVILGSIAFLLVYLIKILKNKNRK